MFGVSRHADLLAVSFASGQDVEDPYFDVLTAAEYNWAGYTFVKGCGNDTTWEADCARSTICVGGYEHTPTGIHLFWGAYDNPSGTDRELPHLVARAGGEESEFIVSTVNDPMNTFTTAHPEAEGTSLAAPVITGMAALMAERWPGYFSRRPEAIKAALMVSADRDVVYEDPRKGHYSDYRLPDEKDGAGIPSAQRVQEIMDNGRIQAGLLEKRLFSGRERDLTPNFHLGPGETVRGVVAWSPCHHAGHETLAVNLNLYLVGQSDEGHAVFIEAASFDNEYEIIEYVALPGQGEPGTYRFVLKYEDWMEECSPFVTPNYAFAHNIWVRP